MGDVETQGRQAQRLPPGHDGGAAALDCGQELGPHLDEKPGHRSGQLGGQHQSDVPTPREIYDPRLGVIIPIVLALSAWLGAATFLGMRFIGASLVVSTFYAISTFFLSLSPFKAYVINTAAMLSRFTRGRWLHRVLQCEPVHTAVYRNRPLARAVEPRTSLTIMIPIYDEPFDLIRRTSLETAIREVEDYGPLANLIVSDDGRMVFSDNALPEFEAAARAKPERHRTRPEQEVILRLDYYGQLLHRPGGRFGVVARPKAVAGRPETERPGTFKKASNLNFTHRLVDAVAALELMVALNGPRPPEAVEHLRTLQREYTREGLSITILDLDGVRGKVNAMNAGIHIARQSDADVMGFVDDDVRFAPGALLKSLDHLMTDPTVILTGPRGGPVRPRAPSGLFARLEAVLATDDSLPFGRGGQFMLAGFCPLIPGDIVHDDLYLDAYCARGGAQGQVCEAVVVTPDAFAAWELTGRLTSYLGRFRRIRMGCRQLEDFFRDTKSVFLNQALAARPLRHRAPLRALFAGLGPVHRVALLALIVYLWLARWWTSVSVDLQIGMRGLLGRSRYEVPWARR